MRISPARAIFITVILFVSAFLLQDITGVQRTPIKQPLSSFPTVLGEWQAVSARTSKDSVIQILGVDDYIEYYYTNSSRQSVNFYAAYYEAVGKGTGYHSPKNCIPGGGWGIETTDTLTVIPEGRKGPVKISEMIIRNGSEYQVVIYWYHNRGRIIYSEYWEKIYLVLDSILKKRRDGTFVRLMAPVRNKDIDGTRRRLIEFAVRVMPELDDFIPGE